MTVKVTCCYCEQPVYWCSTCLAFHHEPWADNNDCVRSIGIPTCGEKP